MSTLPHRLVNLDLGHNIAEREFAPQFGFFQNRGAEEYKKGNDAILHVLPILYTNRL